MSMPSIIESIKAEVKSGELEAAMPEIRGGYTAYQLWKLTNATFQALGIVRDKPLTAQYVYNMVRQGAADGVTYKEGLTGVRFSEEHAALFVRRMVARNLHFLVKTDEEQVVADVVEEVAKDQVAEFDDADESDEEIEVDETEGSGRHGA